MGWLSFRKWVPVIVQWWKSQEISTDHPNACSELINFYKDKRLIPNCNQNVYDIVKTSTWIVSMIVLFSTKHVFAVCIYTPLQQHPLWDDIFNILPSIISLMWVDNIISSSAAWFFVVHRAWKFDCLLHFYVSVLCSIFFIHFVFHI